MTTLTAAGMDLLWDGLNDSTAEDVVYVRGALRVDMKATPVSARAVMDGSGNVAGVERDELDWLIAVDRLVLSNEVKEPEKGDRIERIIGDATLVYEVLPLAGAREWDWVDASQSGYRIHTKLIDGGS